MRSTIRSDLPWCFTPRPASNGRAVDASPPEQAAILAVPAAQRALAPLDLEAIDRVRENALELAAARVSEGHLQPLPQRPGGSRHRLDPLSKTYAVLAVVHRETHDYPFKA